MSLIKGDQAVNFEVIIVFLVNKAEKTGVQQ